MICDQSVPGSVVYQCENCREICCTGRERTGLCPECRTPLLRVQPREPVVPSLKRKSNVLEMENTGMDCPNKENGCDFILHGKDDHDHIYSCMFRKPPLCKLIGFMDCKFTSSHPFTIFKHFNEVHHCNLYIAPAKGVITFKDFDSFTKRPYDRAGCTLWEVHWEENSVSRFLIYREINKAKGDYIFVCFYMGENPKEAARHLIEISIRDSRKETTKWKWTGEPTHFMDAEDHIINPPFRIPLKYLRKHHIGGEDASDLAWEISVLSSPNNRCRSSSAAI